MDIAFLTTRLDRPSFRFRVQQFFPELHSRGHRSDTIVLGRRAHQRLAQYRNLPQFDAVVVQKRLFSTLELRVLRYFSRRLVYDLDDAMMFRPDGRRCRQRTRRMNAVLKSADLIICGNHYLADQAGHARGNVMVLPTVVDTDRFRPVPKSAVPAEPRVTIGWTGSRGTNPCLNELLPVLGRLPRSAQVKIMSDSQEGLDMAPLKRHSTEFVYWSAEREVKETSSFDIGVMPLSDNAWTRGKCGCKALQYMALGIPAVCSPVGVNREIIRHKVNGCLADTPAEWQSVLTELVTDSRKRQELGLAGRRRVEQDYSVRAVGDRFVSALERDA